MILLPVLIISLSHCLVQPFKQFFLEKNGKFLKCSLVYVSVSRETTGDTCEIGLIPSLMLFHLSEDLTSIFYGSRFRVVDVF